MKTLTNPKLVITVLPRFEDRSRTFSYQINRRTNYKSFFVLKFKSWLPAATPNQLHIWEFTQKKEKKSTTFGIVFLPQKDCSCFFFWVNRLFIF